MFNDNTLDVKALLGFKSITENMRQEIERSVNTILEAELTSFLNYEKHDVSGYNSGNSRNGFYTRTHETPYGPITVKVPRDRNGEFRNSLLPYYKRRGDDLEETVIHLYQKGVTTSEIAALIERIYGHHYSKQTISNITKIIQKDIEAFHNRELSKKYVVVYCDATYISLRRTTVCKEALHVLIGITPDGQKEVIDYTINPNESASIYADMLNDAKTRGLEEVEIFVTDNLPGLANAVLECFPQAKHQRCWVHIMRNISNRVRKKDRMPICDDLKKVYKQDTREQAVHELRLFLDKWHKAYPKLATYFSDLTGLFEFYSMPKCIQRSVYTTNVIESFNKKLKRTISHKEQFPNEDSLERFVVSLVLEYNAKNKGRAHHGFKGLVTF